MNRLNKYLLAGSAIVLSTATAMAQTPAEDIEAAAVTATTVFGAFAAITVTAFVFAMVIGYARKGKK